MLAGINLQPGAWDPTTGTLNDVRISDVTLHNVATPFHFVLKKGNTAGRIVVDRASATGVYRAAASVESWADSPFEQVVLRDVTIEFEGGGPAGQVTEVKSPGVDARPLPAWGLYARNVGDLELDNVRLRTRTADARPVMICHDVERLTMRQVSWPEIPSTQGEPVVLKNVKSVHRSDQGE